MAEPKPRAAIRRLVEFGLKGEGRETVDLNMRLTGVHAHSRSGNRYLVSAQPF